jgi:GGDEF domain-containing protein
MTYLFSLKDREKTFDYVLTLINIILSLTIGSIVALSDEKIFFFITPLHIIFLIFSIYLLKNDKIHLFQYVYSASTFIFYALLTIILPPERNIWIFIYPLLATFFSKYELGLILSLLIMVLLGIDISLKYRIVSFDVIPPKLSLRLHILLAYIFVLIIAFIRFLRVNTYINFLEKIYPVDLETGALSRYQLEKEIEQAISLLKRYDFPFLYIAIGIEKLRKLEPYNAQKVLAELVSGIKSIIRDSDFIARYNKGLFIVQLANTSSEKAQPVIERINKYLEEFSKEYSIKVNIAVTDLEKDDTVDTLIEKLLRQLRE